MLNQAGCQEFSPTGATSAHVVMSNRDRALMKVAHVLDRGVERIGDAVKYNFTLYFILTFALGFTVGKIW